MGFIYNAHIDYITTTWPSGSAAAGVPSIANIVDWARRRTAEKGAREEVKAWAWNGYTGWSIGSLCFGDRSDGTILRISSALAHTYVNDKLPTGHNVSRLDICIDVWGVSEIDKEIALHKDAALAYRATLHSRPFDVRLQETFGRGDTLYLGSRASGLFIRIYNKDKEQSTDEFYQDCIRYECEIKDDRAAKILERYRVGGYRGMALQESLLGFLERRGIRALGLHDSSAVYTDADPRLRGDIDRTLIWYREQIAPSVRRLLSLGYRGDIIEALGLEQRKEDRNDG